MCWKIIFHLTLTSIWVFSFGNFIYLELNPCANNQLLLCKQSAYIFWYEQRKKKIKSKINIVNFKIINKLILY